MNKKVIILIAVIILLFAGLSLGIMYNDLVRSEEMVKEKWAQVENVYQRRLDLVPNLVETVKGYAAHEKSTFLSVTEARSKAVNVSQNKDQDIISNPEKFREFQNSQATLSNALSRLFLVVERYPDLKANENFIALQSQLEGTENRISVERKRYNEVARIYNSKLRQFPTNFIANMFGFKIKEYFQSDASAKEVPKVKF